MRNKPLEQDSVVYRQRYLRYYCQMVLPAVYDDSLSYYELLNKVVKYLNDTIHALNENADIIEQKFAELDELKKELDELQEEMDKWKNGDYISQYIEALIQYFDENIIDWVSRVVKYVSFGLDEKGYFKAYIPFSWKFLKFDTIMDCEDSRYGHLILRY